MKRGEKEVGESVDMMGGGGGFGYPLSFRIKHQRWSCCFLSNALLRAHFVLFFLSLYMHLWWKGKEREVYITTYILALGGGG